MVRRFVKSLSIFGFGHFKLDGNKHIHAGIAMTIIKTFGMTLNISKTLGAKRKCNLKTSQK